MRVFTTGATRNDDTSRLDFEGFLDPNVLIRYAEYMNKNRVQADGNVRESDNWQKGIPQDVYMKSLLRHTIAMWKHHRAGQVDQDEICAIMFNVMGYLHEELKLPSIKNLQSDVDL